MTDAPLTPTTPGVLAGHARRLDNAERRLTDDPTHRAERRSEKFRWSSTGTAPTVVAGAADEVEHGGARLILRARLTAALTGSTTVAFKVNGTTVGTLTIAGGSTSAGPLRVDKVTSPGDVVQASVTAAGTGTAVLSATMTVKT